MPAFLKKVNPYILINTVGITSVLISFLSERVKLLGAMLAYLVFYEAVENIAVAVLAVVLINIFAFLSVKKDNDAGVILSLLGGVVCSFIAVKIVNTNYCEKKAVYIIFNIFIWILVWSVSSLLMLAFS